MKKMKNLLAAVLVLALSVGLSACGQRAATGYGDRYEGYAEQAPMSDPVAAAEPEAAAPVAAQPAAAEPEATEPMAQESPVTDSGTESRIERLLRLQAERNAGSGSGQEPAQAPEAAMESAERVAELGKLTGTGRLESYRTNDTVDVNDEHNPYDLVWQYGDAKTEKGSDFGKLYASYVAAADWTLVFDAEYYKKAFPMLAMLYHDDDALLLEHFQTVGVHEGRQGSENFNVSVYMAHCGKDLLEAFGDNYECYYFYYMLNYGSEQKVETAGVYGTDPLWLDLELTLAQSTELNQVNRYREEVGADPLVLDPENMAFANYRAWYNATHSVHGHGWLNDLQNKEVDTVFDILGVGHLGENTLTQLRTASRNTSFGVYAHLYRDSKSHYEAMVRTKYVCLGVSHQYYNSGTNCMSQFDTFLYAMPAQDFTMR